MKRNADPALRVRDVASRETFSVSWDNTATVRTMDGVQVKLHPNSIRVFVPVGGKFDGKTLTGTRPMQRVK